jgi:hypothetical protein
MRVAAQSLLLVELVRSTADEADPVRELIAQKITGLAQAVERDPERLCCDALKDLPPRPSHLPSSAPTRDSSSPKVRQGAFP